MRLWNIEYLFYLSVVLPEYFVMKGFPHIFVHLFFKQEVKGQFEQDVPCLLPSDFSIESRYRCVIIRL